MPTKIYVTRDGDLGPVAFPVLDEPNPVPLAATETPVEVLLFETVSEYQVAKKQFLVGKILDKLTPEEVALLKEAFSVPAA